MTTPARYCLRCYAPIEADSGASSRCAACGFVTLAVDRRIYWNREPKLVALESSLKVVVFVLTLVTLAISVRGHFSISAGYVVAGALVPAGILWATASKLTRRMPLFRAGAFWIGTCLGLALLPVFVLGVIALLAVSSGPQTGPTWIELFGVFWILAIWGGLCGLLALGMRRIVRRCEAWRDQRIESGRSRHVGDRTIMVAT